jgi:hypothetical protein
MSIKKGKDIRAHQSPRLLLEHEWRLDSCQGFACASTTKLEPLQLENYKYCVVCSEFYPENPYIGVEGSFHRLNWVGLELMDGRAAIHIAGQPLLLVSTNFWTWDTLVNRLRSIAVNSRCEPTQSVAGRSALMPLWIVVWPHVVYVLQTFL